MHIFPISDLHIGSNNFNKEYFNHALKMFSGIKGPKVIYLLGDILEAASLKVGNSSFKQKMSLNEQLNLIRELLWPYRKYIRGSCPGNHEARLKKDYDLDVSKILAEILDINYSAYILDTLRINNKPFTVFGTHGKGSSQYYHTSVSKVERETQYFNADLYLYGHLHRSASWSNTYKDFKDQLKRRYYILTGHYLSYEDSYAMDMALPELPESFTKIKVGKACNIETIHYNIDTEEKFKEKE